MHQGVPHKHEQRCHRLKSVFLLLQGLGLREQEAPAAAPNAGHAAAPVQLAQLGVPAPQAAVGAPIPVGPWPQLPPPPPGMFGAPFEVGVPVPPAPAGPHIGGPAQHPFFAPLVVDDWAVDGAMLPPPAHPPPFNVSRTAQPLPALGGLSNLTSLELGDNLLEAVPAAVTKLRRLVNLSLRDNPGLQVCPHLVTPWLSSMRERHAMLTLTLVADE